MVEVFGKREMWQIVVSEKDWQAGEEADWLWRWETRRPTDAEQPKQKWGEIRSGKGNLSLFVFCGESGEHH